MPQARDPQRKLKELVEVGENAGPRKLLAELTLNVSTLKAMPAQNSDARLAAIGRHLGDYRERLLPAMRLHAGWSGAEELFSGRVPERAPVQ